MVWNPRVVWSYTHTHTHTHTHIHIHLCAHLNTRSLLTQQSTIWYNNCKTHTAVQTAASLPEDWNQWPLTLIFSLWSVEFRKSVFNLKKKQTKKKTIKCFPVLFQGAICKFYYCHMANISINNCLLTRLYSNSSLQITPLSKQVMILLLTE